MEYFIPREYKRFRLALALSLALHAVLLAIKLSAPAGGVRQSTNRSDSRLDVALTKPKISAKSVPERAKQPESTSGKLVAELHGAAATETAKTWSRAEKDEMNQFLNELTAQSKPRSGQDLEQRALATSRSMAAAEEDNDELQEMAQKFMDAKVDPFSLEMYFDALFRKMNRSAAMVKNERRAKGAHVAAVRVVVNQDGSMKSFRVLLAGDQQAEIAYIKAVMDQAAPFPVFPADIRSATDSIVLQICILPGRYGGGSGATFTRMSKGQSCREPESG